MTENRRDRIYVRVKDRAGNQFVCPIDALKNPKDMSEEALAACVDNAVIERYAGDIEIRDDATE